MNSTAPQFLFRGTRDYLHSSTIFDYLLPLDDDPTKIDFVVHKMTGNQCTVSTELLNDGEAILISTYRSAGLTRYLYETDHPMQGSYPCNEKEICSQTTFSNDAGDFSMPPIESASYIESAVGVYKNLIPAVEPDEKRKLVFARMTLDYVPADGSCRVQHRRRIGRDFLESRMDHNGNPIGKLIFGLV